MTKELSYEFIWETGRQKYFLVKKDEAEYFIFRTPPSSEKSKNQVDLANWEGEVVPWGGVPVKIRSWLGHKKVSLASPKSTTIIIQT